MKHIFIILFLFFAIGFVLVIERLIRRGKLERVNTYSFRGVIKRTFLFLGIALFISVLIYIVSKSIEITITIGSLLIMGVVGSCIYGLLWEYQTKRRGGRKVKQGQVN
jgi:hypothetical protein